MDTPAEHTTESADDSNEPPTKRIRRGYSLSIAEECRRGNLKGVRNLIEMEAADPNETLNGMPGTKAAKLVFFSMIL